MDCVEGELLIDRVRRSPEIEKEILLSWIRQLLFQIEQFHRCRNNHCYQFVNPYSVLVTKHGDILLLDLDAESNAFVMKNMQKRAMREHFVRPIIHIKDNTKLSLDLYGYAKTVQFLLASMKVNPPLTRREEYRLAKVIDKCLRENEKKQYGEWKQVERDLPRMKTEDGRRRTKWIMAAVLAGTVLSAGITGGVLRHQRQTGSDPESTELQSPHDWEDKAESAWEKDTGEGDKEAAGPADRLDEAEEAVDVMEQYLLRNSSKDHLEVIRQGEVVHRELLRCLAAAYDSVSSKERALEAYRELCGLENQVEYLEAAYARRISLERELLEDPLVAVETGAEARARFPASERLAQEYAEAIYPCTALSTEEQAERLQPLTEQFPGICESENYKKWIDLQMEQSEKEAVDENKAAEEEKEKTAGGGERGEEEKESP